MSPSPNADLGRRERQIMDVVYQLGRASVGDVREHLPDPPSYSAVRAMLNLLEDKGHLTHEQDGLRYMYKPPAARAQVRPSALRHVVQTFFDGSPTNAVAALLEMTDGKLSASDRERLPQRDGSGEKGGEGA